MSVFQSAQAFDSVFMSEEKAAAMSVLGGRAVGSSHAVVTAGEVITTEAGFLRGHGTYVDGDRLIASVSGVVERVNKLISVRPLKARYTGEIGDVVVGRVTEVGQKRWKVDINGCQDAVMMLSAVNLHGGVLRRRTQEDQLQMRQYFVPSDVICAEVQQFYGDGCMSIHARSLKFGKLENGQFAAVAPTLVKRLKQHFVKLPCGVDLIIGCNGYVWIQESEELTAEEKREEDLGQGAGSRNAESMQQRRKRHAEREVGFEARQRIARVANAVRLLNDAFMTVSPETIMDVYEASTAAQLPPHEMNDPENFILLVKPAHDRIMGDS